MSGLKLRPSDFKELDDLAKLPILTKWQVRANLEKLQAINGRQYSPRRYRTSGSTGTPLEVLLDRPSNIVEFATYWWHWSWAGYRLGDIFINIQDYPFNRYPKLKNRSWYFDRRMRCLYISTKFNVRDIHLYLEPIKRFQPKFVKARPARVALFADVLKEAGIKDLTFKAVFSGGANLRQREAVAWSEIFGCQVYDSYGQMERVANFRQCDHGRYHVNAVYGIVEVLDDHECHVNLGDKGTIIGTGLHNFSMPLIRYNTLDVCTPSAEINCGCGRTLPQIQDLYGCAEDNLMTPDGRHLTGIGYLVFSAAWGIRLGQLVQTRKDAIEARVVKDVTYQDSDGRALLDQLRKKTGPDMKLKLVFVDDIEPTEEGKFKWVRSEVA
jgi:phenylacetate-CoA ligase